MFTTVTIPGVGVTEPRTNETGPTGPTMNCTAGRGSGKHRRALEGEMESNTRETSQDSSQTPVHLKGSRLRSSARKAVSQRSSREVAARGTKAQTFCAHQVHASHSNSTSNADYLNSSLARQRRATRCTPLSMQSGMNTVVQREQHDPLPSISSVASSSGVVWAHLHLSGLLSRAH